MSSFIQFISEGTSRMTKVAQRKMLCTFFSKKKNLRVFPGGSVVKNPPTNAGDTGSSPGPGRSYMPQSN